MKKKKLIISSVILLTAAIAIIVALFVNNAQTTYNNSIQDISQSTDSAFKELSAATTTSDLNAAIDTLSNSPYLSDSFFAESYKETVYKGILELAINGTLYSDSEDIDFNLTKCQKVQQLLDELYVETPYSDDLTKSLTIQESYFDQKIETSSIATILYSDALEKYDMYFEDLLEALNDRNFDLFFVYAEDLRTPIDELFSYGGSDDLSQDYLQILLDYYGTALTICEGILYNDTTAAYQGISDAQNLLTDKKNFETDTFEYLAEIDDLASEAQLLLITHIEEDYEITYDFSSYLRILLTNQQ